MTYNIAWHEDLESRPVLANIKYEIADLVKPK